MPKKPYTLIQNLTSEEEPKEYRPYGLNGVDLIANCRQEDGLWVYDVLRFDSKADFVLYQKLNG